MDVPAGSSNRRYTFSLRGMMLLVLGVAVGLAVLRMKNADWSDGALAAATAWIVLGLVNQVRDLWVSFRHRDDLSRDECWGWRFAIAWRICIAGFLVAYWCVEFLLDQRVLALPARDDGFDAGKTLRSGLFYLSLLVALSTAPRPPRKPRRRTSFAALVNFLGWFAAIMFGVLVIIDQTAVFFLVYLAATSIEKSWSLQFAREGVDMIRTAAVEQFCRAAFLATAVTAANIAAKLQLAKQWTRGTKHRLFWSGVVTLGLVINCLCLKWINLVGLPAISPDLAEANSLLYFHHGLFVFAVLGILATIAAFRLVATSGEKSSNKNLQWRRNPRSYYNERVAVLSVVILTIVAYPINSWYGLLEIVPFLGQFMTWPQIIFGLLATPLFTLQLAILLVASRQIFVAWWRPAESPSTEPVVLPAARFCGVWIATLLTLAVGIATLAWFSFALWLTPWWWRWPPP